VLYHLHVTLHLSITWTSPVTLHARMTWTWLGYIFQKMGGFHPFIPHDLFNFLSNMYETAFIHKKMIFQNIITSKVILYTLARKTIFPRTIILITHSKPQICDLVLHYCINTHFTFTAISSLICKKLSISVAAM
jgi:hypothetical protein